MTDQSTYDVRIVIDRFEVTDDRDPWWLGPGEISFRAEVVPDGDETRAATARLPSHGTFRMTEGTQVVCREVYNARLPADADLTLRCTGVDSDLLDDDEFVRYERRFTGSPTEWAGEYGPDDEPDDPEALADWRIWYTIEVAPVESDSDGALANLDAEEREKFERRNEFFREQFGDSEGNVPSDVWETGIEATRASKPPKPIDDDPGGPAPDGGEIELLGSEATAERTSPPVETTGMDAVDVHVAVEGDDALRGTLRVGLDPEMVNHVTPSTLRVFRFDEATEEWQFVHRSGLGNRGDYLWAKVNRPGIYGVFGLPRDRASRATIGMMAAARQSGRILQMADMGTGKPEICQVILCRNPTAMSEVLDNPARLERHGTGDYVDEPSLLYGRDMTDIPVNEKGKPLGMPDGYTPVSKADEYGYEGLPGIRPGGGDVCEQCLGTGGSGGLGGPGIDIHDHGHGGIDVGDVGGGGGITLPAPGEGCEHWESVGPDNIAGRVSDVVYHPTDGDVVYAGVAGGGVWKSTDGGDSWRPTMSGELSLVVGAVGVAPSDPDVVYAATGEYLPWWTGVASSHTGDGVYRSTNGGKDWDLMPRDGFRNGRCSQVVVDPSNPDRVYVAGWRGIHRWNESRGRWEQILDRDVSDLAMHPGDSTELLAATGSGSDAILRTTNATASDPGQPNVGVTWSAYDSGIDVPDNTRNLAKVAYAPSDPSVIYASVNDEREKSDGSWTHDGARFYRWDGSRWVDKNKPVNTTYAFWCHALAVNPTDVDNVLVGGVSIYETSDGGDSFTRRRRGHADIQAAAFDPTDSEKSLIANDGGVFGRDTSTGDRDFSSANRKLTTIQFYNVSVSQTDTFRIGGSTQDQGILKSDDGSTYYGLRGNEGGLFQIDPNDEDTIYWDPWNRDLQKTTDGANSGARSATNGISGGSVTALAVQPGDSDTLVCANKNDGSFPLYFSDDGAADSPGTGWQQVLEDADGKVSRMAYAPSDTNVVYAITRNGDVWSSNDEGRNWTQASATGLPGGKLLGLAVDHRDADTVFVTIGGSNQGTDRVWKSTDGGANFEDISGVESHTRLPDLSFTAIVQHPTEHETLFVSTPTGVFVTRDGGDWWYPFDKGLPNAWVSGMTYSEPTNSLYVSTIGYGMWGRSV